MFKSSKISGLLKRYSKLEISAGQTTAEKNTARFFLAFYPLTFVFFSILIYINIFIQHEPISAFYYFLALLAFTAWNIYVIATKKIVIAQFLASLTTLIIGFYLFFEGGLANHGYLWITLFPPIVFFLNGTKKGLIWVFLEFAVLAVIVFLGYKGMVALPVDTSDIFEVTAVLFFSAAFAGFSEYVLEGSINKLEKTNQDLSLLAAIVRDSSESIISADLDGNITSWNTGAEKMFGYSSEEVIGKAARSVIIPKNLIHASDENLAKVAKGIRVANFHAQRKKKDGTLFDANITYSPIKSGSSISGVSVMISDITRERAIDKMKTEFVSLASHQLRTPLTSIKWGLEIFMKDEKSLNSKQKAEISDIYRSNERMIELVNSLLNISRIESGKIIVSPKPTKIAEFIADVIKKANTKIEEKNIIIKTNIASNLPEIDLDPDLISNVYQNLLGNAVDYSPKGSKIILTVKKEGEKIISSIADSGIGIPENEKARVFERFYRAGNAKKIKPDGTGLGLYIAKSIVESSGGKIWFESKAGRGTTFYFSLPLTGMKPKSGEVTLS